ncbi:hypothetical protein D1Z90_08380 [Motilimonas pumila]|uniref:Flagellin N-terminal domain-containing protein n=2 Tax=Motilimonas pumila TaxID=2303987 RepID=A0A418YG28_9GAMM|nr:hypothetical protein D1Z90_08380 [Motilimonas pumila]
MQVASQPLFQPTSFLQQQKQKQEEETEKLSSGQRINSAADDPAGFAIAQRLTSQINQSNQLYANEVYNQSVAGIESSGLANTGQSVMQLNELVLQSGNGAYSSDDIAALQGEIDEIVEGLDSAQALGLDQIDLVGKSLDDNLQILSDAQDQVLSDLTDLGAQINGSTAYQSQLNSAMINQSAARSRILDTDYAASSSGLANADVLLQAAAKMKQEKEEQEAKAVNGILG